MDENSVIIEEVDGLQITDAELSEFIETDIPIEIEPVEQSTSHVPEIEPQHEEELIKKYISGELTFTEYTEQMGENFNEIVDAEDEEEPPPVPISEKSPAVTDSESDKFSAEHIQFQKDKLRGHRVGRHFGRGRADRKRSLLPPALQGLMGEANLCYARGQNELAEKVCLEIIRQVPLAAEPFLTLAQIHDSNPEKSMQFNLIAAHLDQNSKQWVRLSDMAIEQGNTRQAINCLMKASKHDQKNVLIRKRRIQLLESIGEDQEAFRCRFYMLRWISAEDWKYLMEQTKLVSKRLWDEKNYTRALEAMRHAYTKALDRFNSEDLNLYLDLLLANEEWGEVIYVLSTHTTFVYQSDDSNNAEPISIPKTISTCSIPDDLILDYRSKCIIGLIHLKAFHLNTYLLENISQFITVELAGDCLFDIAEAFMKESQFVEAMSLLDELVQSSNFSLAAVWLRHADCLRALNKIDQAIESYKQVVELAPQHFDARLTLSALLKQQRRDVEALQALEQDMQTELIDPYVLYERCFMLKETGNLREFMNVGFQLIMRHCKRLRNRNECNVAVTFSKTSTREAAIIEMRRLRQEPVDDADAPEFLQTRNEPSPADEWNLFLDLISVASQLKEFEKLQQVLFAACTSRRFLPHRRDIQSMALFVSILNRDGHFSYTLAREFMVRNMSLPNSWNIFNLCLQFTDDQRYVRFITRFFRRNAIDTKLFMIRGNYFLSSGSYKYALNDYMKIFRETNEPLAALCIANTYAHMASQKFVDKRAKLIAQAFCFVEHYKRLRESEVGNEIHYNLGRFHQHLGIMHIAVWHYEQVLEFEGEFLMKHQSYLDLKMEAAYNLHVIYMNSGNENLARYYLRKYVKF